MRSVLIACLFSLFFLAVPASPQQTQPVTSPPVVTKEPQAVSVISQALSVAGGVSAINAITDYTATGNVTYHLDSDRDVQGSVTLRGRGLGQLRVDANLPSGVRSQVVNGRVSIKHENGTIDQPQYYRPPIIPSRLALPHLFLRPALTSAGFSLLFKGIAEIDGHSTLDVQIQRINPAPIRATDSGTDYNSVEYFIDVSNFQVVMTQEVVPIHTVRQVHYSDFRPVSGVDLTGVFCTR
jgi:hypothetical protein